MKYIVIQEKKNFIKLLLPNNIYIYIYRLNWYNGNTYIIVIKSIYVIVSKSEILNKKKWYLKLILNKVIEILTLWIMQC